MSRLPSTETSKLKLLFYHELPDRTLQPDLNWGSLSLIIYGVGARGGEPRLPNKDFWGRLGLIEPYWKDLATLT